MRVGIEVRLDYRAVLEHEMRPAWHMTLGWNVLSSVAPAPEAAPEGHHAI